MQDQLSALSFVTTADGSKTVFNSIVGENYHSHNGALQESEHVFLNSGLRYFLAGHDVSHVSVLEVGFGTGLNFLLSADFCSAKQIQLNYTGIEAYPLSADMLSQTGYQEYTSAPLWEQFITLHPEWMTQTTALNTHCQLHVAKSKLLDFNIAAKFDVIYFDAFASAYQPEMWNAEAIQHTLQFLKPGGIFVTYAITGNLKRIMKSNGLKVEKAPGAAGKREMLRATLPPDVIKTINIHL